MKKKVTFEVDEAYIEMIGDLRKQPGFREFSRSAVIRQALHTFLERLGYALTRDMDSSERMALASSMGIKEGEKMPTWIRRMKLQPEKQGDDV